MIGMIWVVMGALFLVGCGEKVKVVYKSPEIRISEPYLRKDGARCRDVVVIRKENTKIEADVESVCVR